MKSYEAILMSRDGEVFHLNRDLRNPRSPFFDKWAELCTLRQLLSMVNLETLNPKIKINATDIAKLEARSPRTIRSHLRWLADENIIKKKYGEVEILHLEKYMVD